MDVGTVLLVGPAPAHGWARLAHALQAARVPVCAAVAAPETGASPEPAGASQGQATASPEPAARVADRPFSALADDPADGRDGAGLARRVARTAIVITALAPVPPLLLVVSAGGCDLLAGLAVAQRAARRRVAGYVLLAPAALPAPGGDWPDAPVTLIAPVEASDAARATAEQARLRGWEIIMAEEAGPALLDLVERP